MILKTLNSKEMITYIDKEIQREMEHPEYFSPMELETTEQINFFFEHKCLEPVIVYLINNDICELKNYLKKAIELNRFVVFKSLLSLPNEIVSCDEMYNLLFKYDQKQLFQYFVETTEQKLNPELFHQAVLSHARNIIKYFYSRKIQLSCEQVVDNLRIMITNDDLLLFEGFLDYIKSEGWNYSDAINALILGSKMLDLGLFKKK